MNANKVVQPQLPPQQQQQQQQLQSLSTTQHRFNKSCESFCNRLRKFNLPTYKKFADLTKKYKKSQQKLEYFQQMVELFRGKNEIIQELNKLLHPDAKIPTKSTDAIIQQKYEKCCQMIAQICPAKLESFQQIYTDYQQNESIYQQMEFQEKYLQLFSDQPKIKEEINQILEQKSPLLKDASFEMQKVVQPAVTQEASPLLKKNSAPAHVAPQSSVLAEELSSPLNQQQQQQQLQLQQAQMQAQQALEVRPQPMHAAVGGHGKHLGHQAPMPMTFRNDQQYFTNLSARLPARVYHQLIKLLYIYTECIITSTEMIELVEPVLECYTRDVEEINKFSEIIFSRELSRRKASLYFKPLSETDFGVAKRTTHSYVKRPLAYPDYCSNATELTKEILNQVVVTVPRGSEHQSFLIMRKNQFEDALFKSEDEKYEFDINRRQILQVQRLIDKLLSLPEEEWEQQEQILSRIFSFRILSTVYQVGTCAGSEALELFRENPRKNGAIVKASLSQKLEEIMKVRESHFQRQWKDTAEKNFHRSLDHRSFYFKKHDRKFILTGRFEKEPEFRFRVMNKIITKEQIDQSKDDFEVDETKYYRKFWNSYEGLSNVETCQHKAEIEPFSFNANSIADKNKLPMMIFCFDNVSICEDTLSLLVYYVQNCAVANNSEKEEMKKLLTTIMKTLLNIDYQPIQFEEDQIQEDKLIQKCLKIEGQVFEQIYTFFKVSSSTNGAGQADKPPAASDGAAKADEEEDAPFTSDEERNNKEEQSPKAGKQQGEAEEHMDLEFEGKPEKRKAETGKGHSGKAGRGNAAGGGHRGKGANNGKGHANENNSSEGEDLFAEKEEKNGRQRKLRRCGKKRIGRKKTAEQPPMAKEGSQEDVEVKEENSSEQIEDMFSNSESEEDNEYCKEMQYLETHVREELFWPRGKPNTEIFFCTKQFYVFIRFFYSLKERVYKAFEFSNSFEANSKTQLLSEEEKRCIGVERYQSFKYVLFFLFKMKDMVKYEDFLRSLYGDSAFLLFTVDKVLSATCKALHNLLQDQTSSRMLEEYIQLDPAKKEIKKYAEPVNFVRASNIIHQGQNPQAEKNFFRFYYDLTDRIMYINYIESQYKYWNVSEKRLERAQKYFLNYTMAPLTDRASTQRPVFLQRNKRAAEKYRQKQLDAQLIQYNNIEYASEPNSTRLGVAMHPGQEDVLIRKRPPPPLDAEMRLCCQSMKKVCKLNAWLQQRLSEL